MKESADKFRDAASSVAASYTMDVGSINQSDPFEIQIQKARNFLLEAADLILETDSIEEVSKILMEVIGSIDGPVIYVSNAATSLRWSLATIVESNNPRLASKCLAASVGVVIKGYEDTMTEIAKSHGISKEAVSKRIKDVQEIFGISGGNMNKRSMSGDSYKLSNVRRKKKSDL